MHNLLARCALVFPLIGKRIRQQEQHIRMIRRKIYITDYVDRIILKLFLFIC